MGSGSSKQKKVAPQSPGLRGSNPGWDNLPDKFGNDENKNVITARDVELKSSPSKSNGDLNDTSSVKSFDKNDRNLHTSGLNGEVVKSGSRSTTPQPLTPPGSAGKTKQINVIPITSKTVLATKSSTTTVIGQNDDTSHNNGSKKGDNDKKKDKSKDAFNKAPPPPKPPKTRKEEVFTIKEFQHVDDYIANAPKSLLFGTFKELVDFLLKEEFDEIALARAVFRWVTSVDVYSLKVESDPPAQSPLEYLVKIQDNKGNHAHLFSGICQMVGLPCNIISGMNKSAAYEIGKKCERKTMGAQWNAVYVDGNWRFVDAFWASACVIGRKSSEWTLVDTAGNVTEENDDDDNEGTTTHRINEFYFFPNPDEIIWTHYPDENKWQLLNKTVSLSNYEDHFYVRERFHILKMGSNAKTHPKCVLNAKDGEIHLQFSLPNDINSEYRFKTMLYQSRKSAEIAERKDILLDRFVFFEHGDDYVNFELRFPVKGQYKMDVFALDNAEEDAAFDLACTYLIDSPKAKAHCMPLPDCPPLGWGPGQIDKDSGIKADSHKTAIIKTADGNVELRFKTDKDIQMYQSLKHALLGDAVLSGYTMSRIENGEAIINIRVPQAGEYAIKVYANDEGTSGQAPNLCNYLIQAERGCLDAYPNFPDGKIGPTSNAQYFGVEAISHPGGILDAPGGKAEVKFKSKPNVELLCELHSTDTEARRVMKVDTKFVNGEWILDVDVPKSGEYSMNIFAREKGKDNNVYNVHSYLVKSSGRDLTDEEKEKMKQSDESKEVEIETINTSEKEVMIPVPPGCTTAAAYLQRKNANDPPKENKCEVLKSDDDTFVDVTMKEFGEYLLNVYDTDENGNLKLVAKYQINRKPAGELEKENMNLLLAELGAEKASNKNTQKRDTKGDKSTENDNAKKLRDKKEQLRKQIERSMELRDEGGLEAGIRELEGMGVKEGDDPLLKRAKKYLAVLKAKQELTDASQQRDIDALEKALKKAKAVNFERQLDLGIAMGTKLLDHLKKLESLRHAVMNMEQKTISELRAYGNPPSGIHEVMMATLILLGHSKKEVKVWKTIQALIGKIGKESLLRKVSNFDPKKVTLDVAAKAKTAVEEFTGDEIRDKSAGAATFYFWAAGMIEEIENSGGAGPGEEVPAKKKSTPRPKSSKHTDIGGNGNKGKPKSAPKK